MSSSSLKRNQTESCLENRKCENISMRMLHLVILSIFTQKKYFLLRMCAPQGQPCWFTLNQWKTEKNQACDVFDTVALYSGLVDDVHSCVLATPIFNKRDQKSREKCCMYIIYSILVNTFVLPLHQSVL